MIFGGGWLVEKCRDKEGGAMKCEWNSDLWVRQIRPCSEVREI